MPAPASFGGSRPAQRSLSGASPPAPRTLPAGRAKQSAGRAAYLSRESNMSTKEKETMPMASIVDRIIILRDVRVMLDRDLAELYGLETRVLNQSVSRNIRRFPKDFMFTITREEIMSISQYVTSSKLKFSKRVRVFTEQGVAMLSSVLNSQRAIEVNIAIIRTFVHLRRILSAHTELAQKLMKLEEKIEDHDQQILAIFEAIKLLLGEDEKPGKKIGYIKECLAKYDKHI